LNEEKNVREAPATDTTVTITSFLLLLFLFVATTQTMRGGGGGSQRFWLTLLLLVLAVVGGNWLLLFCGPYRNSIIESTTVPRTTTVNRRTTQTTHTSRSDVVPVVSQTTSNYATMADDVVAMLEAQMKYRVFKRKKIPLLAPQQPQQHQLQPQPQHHGLFLPPATLSQFDMYGAAWWQSIDRFMQDDYQRIWTLEDGTFRPIYAAGNGSLDVRMTVDWLELAVEHWSDYQRLLDTNASQHVIAQLEAYVSATITTTTTTTAASSSSSTNTTITAMQSTLAVLPFQACNKDERVELRVNGNFCTTALTATIASLVRQGVGRVIIVTSYDDHSLVQDAIDDLARRFATTTTIVVIPTDIIIVGKWKHLPKTALVGLYEAWRVQNTTWLGSSNNNPRDNIKYIYYTEPDQILIGQLSTSVMQSTMDRHHILVPHRLEVMPHEDDFRHIETASVKIPSSSTHLDDDDNPVVVLDAPGACCDSGRKQRVQRCPGELAWYKCAFPPFHKSFADVFGQQQRQDGGHVAQLMRIQQGSGLTVLTMQGIGVENSFCHPQRTGESCQTTTTADQDFGVGVAID
jgi:hypothetical protein